MIDLDHVISGTQAIPAMPQSASRLSALFSQEDWELDQITETVSLDPVLTGRVFRTANSAAAGGVRSIASIDQAVMRIGPGAILALALGAAARKRLDVTLPCYGLTEGQLWRHSVAAALAVECARKHTRDAPPPEAFAAALLHDIGILILANQMSPAVIGLLERSRAEGGRTLTESEMEILGVHHGEVGGLIAQHWELPEVAVEAITFHHSPEDAPSKEGRRLADFVALADAVTVSIDAGVGEPESPPLALLERMGLDEAGYQEFSRDVGDKLEAVLARYD